MVIVFLFRALYYSHESIDELFIGERGKGLRGFLLDGLAHRLVSVVKRIRRLMLGLSRNHSSFSTTPSPVP